MRDEDEVRKQLNKLEHAIEDAECTGRYADAMVMRYIMDVLLWVVDDDQ